METIGQRRYRLNLYGSRDRLQKLALLQSYRNEYLKNVSVNELLQEVGYYETNTI